MNQNKHHDPAEKPDIKEKAMGVGFALGALLLFGTTFPFNKISTNAGVDPLFLSFLRSLLGTATLFPFFLQVKEGSHWSRAEWRLAYWIGFGTIAVAMSLEIYGTKYTTASNASILISLETLSAIVLSVWILKERLSRKMILGGVCALVGMGFVLSKDIVRMEYHGGQALLGDGLLIIAVLIWSLYTVFSKRLTQSVNPIYAIFFVLLFTSISLGVLSFLLGRWEAAITFNSKVWLSILYLGIFGTAIPHLFYYQALKRLMASTVSIMLTTLPVFGIGFSFLLLDERLTLTQGFGALLIMFGVGYAVWFQRNEK